MKAVDGIASLVSRSMADHSIEGRRLTRSILMKAFFDDWQIEAEDGEETVILLGDVGLVPTP